MPTVIGVDPASAKCVAVVLRESGYEIFVHKTKSKEMPERCLEAFRWIRRIVRGEEGPVTLYLERPVYAPKRGGLKALLPLGEVQGSLAAGALSGGATVVRVTPPQWKKAVIGNGAAGKLKIKLYLKKVWLRFYLESEGDIDICDAGAIALYGRKQATPLQGVSRAKPMERARSHPGRLVLRRRSVGRAPRTGVPTLVKNSKGK